MKVQDIASELSVDIREFLGFLRENGVRGAKPGTKLDPGATSKMKRLFKLRKEKKEKSNDTDFEKKTLTFNQESIQVVDIAALFSLSLPIIMKAFLKKGLMVNVNSEIDQETLVEIGKSLNVTVEIDDMTVENELGLKTKVMEIDQAAQNTSHSLVKRPPIITIMGHVDHGKTLLLDTIRKTNVVDGEAGGITQHIGAYQIKHNNQSLTFLDTPGHEAFTSLRARGAQITDIAILVVAADDGVKPQTIEAINHAQVADVPILVAINKVDKPAADIEKVKQQLSQYNLLAEDWGGDTIMVPVSAKKGEGINQLLEMIELLADMQELQATPEGLSKSVVIESNLSAQRGPIATVIVKSGSLSVGDFFVIDNEYGKVRAILNDSKQKIRTLKPGDPGEILGFSHVPQPGAIVEGKANEKECKKHCQQLIAQAGKQKNLQQKMSVSLEALSAQAEEGNLRQLNLIIKADVFGSLEAIKGAIEKIESQDIPIKIIHFSTGSITENDVLLAKASQGIIFGFNSEPTAEAKKCAKKENVSVKTYAIIYEILDDIQRAITGLYKPEFEEIEKAQIEVRELFTFSKVGTIAGCYVLSGKVDRNVKVRVMRNEEMIFEGDIDSLKRFKDDVKEVSEKFECGIVLKGFDTLQKGDLLYCYTVEQKKVI